MVRSPRFRITTWPAAPGPALRVLRTEVAPWRDDGYRFTGAVLGDAELPRELLLREVPSLSLTRDTLVLFMNKYGPLVPPVGLGLLGLQAEFASLWLTGLPEQFEIESTLAEVAWRDQHGLPLVDFRAPPKATDDSFIVHPIERAIVRVRLLRVLVDQWMCHQEDYGDDAALLNVWDTHGFARPESVDDAWREWSNVVNTALVPFKPTVFIALNDCKIDDQTDPVTLYSALVLQLFESVASGIPWHRCANATCGRLFIHQEGRAQYGQHRSSGVRFCTVRCARAATQRTYREKQVARERQPNQKGSG